MKILSDNILLVLLLILTGLGTISCSEDMEEVNDDVQVTFTASIKEDVLTRTHAFGKELNVDRLVVGVFDVGLTRQVYRDTFLVNGSSVDIPLSLPKNQAYRFVFWAYNSTCDLYDTKDLRAIKMIMKKEEDGEPVTTTFKEVEKADAFFAIFPKDDEETGENHGYMVASENAEIPTIELHRPLAQINVGTSGTAVPASFTVENAATRFHPFDGTLSEEEDFTWTFAETTTESFSVKVTETQYNAYSYLALGYLFAPLGEKTEAAKKTCQLELTETDKEIPPFQDAELHANHRSNIVGSFTE